jgi:hypothetical protein
MVRAAAGLYGDENRRKPLEVADHFGSPKLAADNHHLFLVNTVKLENRLRSVHTDSRISPETQRCALASSEQLTGLPLARMHTRYSQGST